MWNIYRWKLKDFAIDKHGVKTFEHPYTGITFKNKKIPNYEKASEMVKELHNQLDYFKLVSWDIAMDEDNQPLLIELYVKSQEINFHQFSNGPLFGKFTREVHKMIE